MQKKKQPTVTYPMKTLLCEKVKLCFSLHFHFLIEFANNDSPTRNHNFFIKLTFHLVQENHKESNQF